MDTRTPRLRSTPTYGARDYFVPVLVDVVVIVTFMLVALRVSFTKEIDHQAVDGYARSVPSS